jgi:alpha 1,2-mannosyltransferase
VTDYQFNQADNPVWRVLGKACSHNEWEVESGQILIDKRGNNGLNLAALHVADHMQANHDFWFLLSGGDKDTFRYAFWALRAHYFAAPRWLSPLGTAFGQDAVWQEGVFCGFVMLQYDIEKNERGQYLPLFLHANLLKHRENRWESQGRRIFQTIKRISQDLSNEPSLDRVRAWVYHDRGMCVDIMVKGADEDEVEAEGQNVVTERFEDVYGGVFKNVEEQWVKAGGKVGVW